MTRSPRPGPRLLVALVCLAACAASLGAVTPRAVLVFVVPASLLGSAVAAAVRPGRPGTALVVLVGAALAWAEVVNVLSGTGSGPAARSSAVAAVLSGLAVLACTTTRPALFLLPVVGLVAGGLSLGAGAEVGPVALAVAVLAVPALRAVQQQHDRWRSRPADRVVACLGLVAALLGGAAGLALTPARAPAVLFPGQADPSVRAGLPDLVPREVPPPDPPRAAAPAEDAAVVEVLLPVAGALVLLAALALLVRLLAVRLAWRRLRQRCDSGDLRTRTSGSWPWLRARLQALGVAVPPDVSPDRADRAEALRELPEDARAGLDRLTPLVVRAGFSSAGVSRAEYRAAWAAADEITAATRTASSRTRRLRAVLRRPPRRTSHL